MRKNPSLGGPFQITPVGGSLNTFAQVSGAKLTQGEIIDLTPFSATLSKYIGGLEAEARQGTEEVVRQVGQRVAQGESMDAVLKDFSSDGSTPTRVKTKLAKVFNEQGIDPTANPAYLKQYYEGQGDVRVLAARSKLADQKVVANIAAAGVAAGEGGSYEAMLKATQEAIGGLDLYSGMGAFGTAAIDRQLLGLAGEVMRDAQAVYQEQVKVAVKENFGAAALLHSQRIAKAIDDSDPAEAAAALQEFGAAYTKLRASGEPDHRQILMESLSAAAQDVAESQGPEAAADYLDTIIDEFAEGTAKVFDVTKEGDSVDLIARGMLLRLKESYSDDVGRDARRKLLARQDKEAEVAERLGTQYSKAFADASLQGPAAVNAVADKLISEAPEGVEGTITREYAAAQRGRWLQQATIRTVDDPNVEAEILGEIYAGRISSAADLIDGATGSGLLTSPKLVELRAKLKVRRETPEVYSSQSYLGFEEDIKRALMSAPQFQTGNGQVDYAALTPVAQELTEKFYQQVDAEMSRGGDEIRQGNPAKWIFDQARGFISEETKSYLGIPAKAQATAKVDDAFRTQKFTESLSSASPDRPLNLGGLPVETRPRALQRVADRLADLTRFSQPTTASQRLAKSYGFAYNDQEALSDDLEALVSDPEPLDANGVKIPKTMVARAAYDAIAMSGTLTIQELLTGKASPATVEKWGGEDRPGMAALLGKRMDLSSVDFLRVPVEESLILLSGIQRDADGNPIGFKMVPELKVVGQQVEDLLARFGQPTNLDSILLYLDHQYNLHRTLRSDRYK